ncbi:MAG: hypothetical protein KKH41_03660 [Candidatus Thermoplasmatota archaeon]|nr:hypothetical protein [Euryarchaeota archaeon]MBU4031318.1 hypothetical protein [Candidatus Thermoplasmatota archaeon]MBU4071725.1 hypothetical protein [Candidatus Thermoplasmatota archaeon]MBU4143910.1 hypothetical protein [Candidatus Thermoplasmatota archaeon]MBU4591662.1 hypothetical protein [Candidatus Thermoplasmatota archaeon]
MLENRKLLVTVTVIAIVGVLSLVAYSTTLGQLEIAIGDIDMSHDGLVVVTIGTITDSRALSDGGASLTISDFNTSSSIGVYVPSDAVPTGEGANLVFGTLVRVTGTVSMYLESPEIGVAKPGDIVILSGPGNSSFELATVMRSVQLFDGMEITTDGQIMDMEVLSSSGNLTGTSFRLRQQSENQTYYLECICFDRDLVALHDEWDSVRITGTISYYENSGCWRMVVEVVFPI